MKTHPAVAAYGSWLSPISASLLTAQSVRISEPSFDGDTIYWLETRPTEKGRSALVRLTAEGERQDLLAPPYSVRTRANEYGGGAYRAAEGTVYMVLDHDQRIYRLEPGGTLQAISPAGNYRYADFWVDPQRQLLLCVREDHTDAQAEPACEIVVLPLDGS